MKDQILKIAGVKSEKEFYKKYPSEEAFMKAHKKEFKKAAMGAKMVNDQLHQLTDFGNPPIAQVGIGMPKQNFNKYLQGTNQAGINPDGSINLTNDDIKVALDKILIKSDNKTDMIKLLSGLIEESSVVNILFVGK